MTGRIVYMIICILNKINKKNTHPYFSINFFIGTIGVGDSRLKIGMTKGRALVVYKKKISSNEIRMAYFYYIFFHLATIVSANVVIFWV